MTSKAGDRSHKRSWKNLLINKRYQLRFTLFMVGLSALVMVGLGIWVMQVANETTEVWMTSMRGEACPKVPLIAEAGPAGDGQNALPRTPTRPEDPSAAAPDLTNTTPGAARRNITVQIEESSMTLTQVMPHDYVEKIIAHWTCELRQAARFDRLERGRLRILWAMIATGLVLVLGLAIYGLKMTHRVAGPLFKVSLYLSKMRAGRFDKVYSLRKGDQLVEFYEHFRLAHDGIVALQRSDIAQIAAVIAAAEDAGAGQHPAVVELRALLARKEKSIE